MSAANKPLDRVWPSSHWSLGFGHIMHTRLRPVRHRFAYRGFYIDGEVNALNGMPSGNLLFGINRRSALSFHESDHGDGLGTLQWLHRTLEQAVLARPATIRFRGFPRVLGYAFKPVSFWFFYCANNQLYAVITEVNNTFGERHCYLLQGKDACIRNGELLYAQKEFHVSPYCDLRGRYQLRFFDGEQGAVVRINYGDDSGEFLRTSLSGSHRPMSARTIAHALLFYPLFTLGVVARIHWQALRIWLKRAPYFTKPEPPETFVTTGIQSSLPASIKQ